MRQTKHGSTLHQLTKLIAFNNYLVEIDDTLTLIDTNFGDNTSAIIAAARQIGKPITRLIVTHAHSDHAGAVDAFLHEVPDAEYVVSERTARLLTGDKSLKKVNRTVPCKAATSPSRPNQPARCMMGT